MYYNTPDNNYWYAPGAIYQVDPSSQMITSVAALLAPGLSVGQPLPLGYDVYNVPYDYRRPTTTRRTPGTVTTTATSTRSTRRPARHCDRGVTADVIADFMDREWPGKRCRAVCSSAETGEYKNDEIGARARPCGCVAQSSACSKNDAATANKTGQTPAATKAAGDKTIAAGLTADSKFMAAAKSAGLDKTLAGPGPYTVFVPDDAAFAQLPAGHDRHPTPEQPRQITAS